MGPRRETSMLAIFNVIRGQPTIGALHEHLEKNDIHTITVATNCNDKLQYHDEMEKKFQAWYAKEVRSKCQKIDTHPSIPKHKNII